MADGAQRVVLANGSGKCGKTADRVLLRRSARRVLSRWGDLRSISHDNIFAAGDIVTRMDRRVARSGVHAVRSGPVLAVNLRARLNGRMFKHYVLRRRTLYLLATGDRQAILSWGAFALAGKLLWRLKDGIDRRFMRHHAIAAERAR